MKKYKLLKDLPGISAGAIFDERNWLGKIVIHHDETNYTFRENEILPEWFEEIKPVHKKSIYATRNIKTNKIEKIFIRNSDEGIDEDRTGFYFEGEFEEDKNGYTERFLNELFLLHKLT